VIVIEYIPELSSYLSLINFVCDLLIALLGISLISKSPKRILIILYSFLVISTINFFLNQNHQLISHINGLRDFLNIFSLFIIFNNIFNSSYVYYFNSLFKKFAIIFLTLQIPFSFLQYIKSGYKAGDSVGGTLSMGGSGLLTLSIFILVYYLIENSGFNSFYKKMGYLFSISFFFLPIVINETKISFILIPLFFITLLDYKDIKTSVVGIVLGLLLFFSFLNFYSDRSEAYKNPVTEIFSQDFLEVYLAGDEQVNEDIPRFTKIALSFQLMSNENSKMLFGHEYGAFKGGTTLELSPFTKKYQWLLQGTVPYLFYLLITGGILLIAIILWLYISQANIQYSNDSKSYSKRLLVFISCLFFLILFYNDAFRDLSVLIFFTYTFFFSLYYKSQLK
jgi:hypothetical protein